MAAMAEIATITGEIFTREANGKKILQLGSDAHTSKVGVSKSYSIAPSTFNALPLGVSKFTISSDQTSGRISSAYLEVNIRETIGVNPADVHPVFMLFGKTELKVNGQSLTLSSIDSVVDYANNGWLSPDRLAHVAADLNLSLTTFKGLPLLAGTSKTLRMPIHGSAISSLNMGTINTDVVIEFTNADRFQVTAPGAGVGTVVVDSMTLRVTEVTSAEHREHQKALVSGSFATDVSYHQILTDSKDITVGGGGSYQMSLSCLQDSARVGIIYVMLRDAVDTANVLNFTSLVGSTINIVDAGGASILGDGAQLGEVFLGQHIYQYSPLSSALFRTVGIVPIILNPSAVSGLFNRVAAGRRFSGSEKLVISFGAGIAGGAAQTLHLYAPVLRHAFVSHASRKFVTTI